MRLSLRELGVLRILGSEGPLTQHGLGKRHKIDRTSIVQLIDLLEERELVQRNKNSEDRRSNFISLTPRGRKTLAKAARLVDKQQKEFLSPLSEAEWEAMRLSLLKLLSHHLTETAPDPGSGADLRSPAFGSHDLAGNDPGSAGGSPAFASQDPHDELSGGEK